MTVKDHAQPEPSASARPSRLRPGPHKLTRDEVAASQRARLLTAFTELLAEQGYADLRIGDLASRAGVSRATFYELFDDKQACLFAAYDLFCARIMNAVTPLLGGDTPVEELIDAVLEGYLGELDRDRVATRAFFCEMMAAGEAARWRRHEAAQMFAGLIAGHHAALCERDPSLAPLPDDAYLALALAARQLVDERLLTQPTAELRELRAPLAALMTATIHGSRQRNR